MNLRRWLANAFYRDTPIETSKLSNSIYPGGPLNADSSFQFTIHIARGGRVVETQRWDRKRDELHRGLYVITDDKEFGQEIDKILTMESLK